LALVLRYRRARSATLFFESTEGAASFHLSRVHKMAAAKPRPAKKRALSGQFCCSYKRTSMTVFLKPTTSSELVILHLDFPHVFKKTLRRHKHY
jgi:hypothetical protein